MSPLACCCRLPPLKLESQTELWTALFYYKQGYKDVKHEQNITRKQMNEWKAVYLFRLLRGWGGEGGLGGEERGWGVQLSFRPVIVQFLPGPFTSGGWHHNHWASVFCFAAFGRSCAVFWRCIFSLERNMVYSYWNVCTVHMNLHTYMYPNIILII